MNDMSAVIIPKSDQISADDLIAGPLTITITGVNIKPGEQPVSISFSGDAGRPFKPCKSMCRVMVALWGADASNYVGRSMTIYRDPSIKWGGMEVGGIRISHLSHINAPSTMALTLTKGSKKPFTVRPLVVAAPVEATPAPPKVSVRDLLRDALAAATSRDDVAETRNIPGVAKILRDGPEKQREVLQGMISEALARFADDDAPADDDAERGEYGVAEAAE